MQCPADAKETVKYRKKGITGVSIQREFDFTQSELMHSMTCVRHRAFL